jgi:hypothetical protein
MVPAPWCNPGATRDANSPWKQDQELELEKAWTPIYLDRIAEPIETIFGFPAACDLLRDRPVPVQ